jgi:multiple antibiotic resistance protein
MLSFAFSTLTTLLLVVDAPAAVPLFLSMTEADSVEHRQRTAFRAALAAGIVLASFGALGGIVFRVLGISLGAFRIAGGVLLFLLAVDMLRAQRSRQRTSPEEEADGVDRPDISIFPMAIPMLAGPGATSTVMVLVSRAERPWQYVAVFVAIGLTALTAYGFLRSAVRVERRLGRTGMNVLQRVMGLILAATAVQFVVEGVSDVLPTIVGGLAGSSVGLGQRADGGDQDLGLEGLGDPGLGAGLLRSLHQRGDALGGEHQDGQRRVRAVGLDLLDHLDAVQVGHVDVAHHRADPGNPGDLVDPVDPVDGLDHLEPRLPEGGAHLLPHRRGIIHHQYLRLHHAVGSSSLSGRALRLETGRPRKTPQNSQSS